MSKKKSGTGDDGTTSLFDGTKVSKHSAVIDALGDLDECNSLIGYAIETFNWSSCLVDAVEIKEVLGEIQRRLLDAGSHIATPLNSSKATGYKLERTLFSEELVEGLEKQIEAYDSMLPKLTTFIIPGGKAALFHVIRSVARRAERCITILVGQGHCSPTVSKYMNRLSDFFFVLSRLLSEKDVVYKKPSPK